MDSKARKRLMWTSLALSASLGVVLARELLPDPLHDNPYVQIATLVLCVLVVVPFAVLARRDADEVLIRSHETSFIAAGAIGGLVTLVGLMSLAILLESGMPGPFGLSAEQVFFMLIGAVLSILVIGLFYILFLVQWWR